MNRRLIEALRAFNRSQKRQRFVEDQTKTDENVAHRRTCEMCTATEDDTQAKHCRMCGQKLAEIEGEDEDEISQQFGFPDKSPHSASEDEDEDEKRLRGGYGMKTDERGARRGRADEAIKTFNRTYKRLRGV